MSVDLKLLLEHDLPPIFDDQSVRFQVFCCTENLPVFLNSGHPTQLKLSIGKFITVQLKWRNKKWKTSCLKVCWVWQHASKLTCIWELSTVLLQDSSVQLMVSMPSREALICVLVGGVPVPLSAVVTVALAARYSWSSVWMSALYWLARASSYWSVHWRIRLSQPSAVFSSSVLASVVEFWEKEMKDKFELLSKNKNKNTIYKVLPSSSLTFSNPLWKPETEHEHRWNPHTQEIQIKSEVANSLLPWPSCSLGFHGPSQCSSSSSWIYCV